MDPNTRRMFGTLVAAAFADGTLAGPERQVLHRKATEWDIPISLVNQLIAQGEQGKLSVAVPATREQREALLDDLIDIVAADGRVEMAEHQVLGKFAVHLGLELRDLRPRIHARMERRSAPQEPARPGTPAPAAPGPVPPPAPPRRETPGAAPPLPAERPPGPVEFQGPTSFGPKVGDIPPVTLQLLRQAIAFEPEPNALRYIERTLGVPAPEARKIFAAICAAFPDLKPASQDVRGRR
jgi:uncharacterized tellurite resistance protein B-like protein